MFALFRCSAGDPEACGSESQASGTLASLPGAQLWSRMSLGLNPDAAIYWLDDCSRLRKLCVIGFVILDLKKVVRRTSPACCED